MSSERKKEEKEKLRVERRSRRESRGSLPCKKKRQAEKVMIMRKGGWMETKKRTDIC